MQSQLQMSEPETKESIINLDKFKATPACTEPFSYMIVPNFINDAAYDALSMDYPAIKVPGSISLDSLTYGPAFKNLIVELHSDAFRKAVEEKFAVDLVGKPTTVTVRGMCRAKDGKIHTDTESKIITLLLYMNSGWENEGGRLRLLRSQNIDDVLAEIPPMQGTLVAFKRSNNSWHGHKSHAGLRRVVQMNWVTDQKFADRQHARHGWFKTLNPVSWIKNLISSDQY